jgi:DNA-binding transcriptional LysR family regulator
VHDGRLDTGILYRPVADPVLAQRVLSRESLVLALPEQHPAATFREISLQDVRDEPFILPEQHDVPGIHAAITATFADARVAPRAVQRGVWLMQTVLGLVAAGVGLAVVPSSVETVRRAGVVLRPLRDSRHRLEMAAVWRGEQVSGPLVGMLDVIEVVLRLDPTREGAIGSGLVSVHDEGVVVDPVQRGARDEHPRHG